MEEQLEEEEEKAFLFPVNVVEVKAIVIPKVMLIWNA